MTSGLLSNPRLRWGLLAAALIVGTGLRLAFVNRPFDERSLAPWREADYAQIARSFHREGMDIRYPRIDWRGTTSGAAEMEFPAVPWLAALLYGELGYHEEILRILTALASVGGLFVFLVLARSLLPATAALVAVGVFALNPLLVLLSGAMQPEPVMLLLSLVAVTLVERWRRTDSRGWFLAACVVTGMAILSKAPAAHLGLLLAYFTLRRFGRRAFVAPIVWVGAALALLPPLAWYLWARKLCAETGISLGVSNETHLINAAILRAPYDFLHGNLHAEWIYVFTPAGLLLAALAVLRPHPRIELPLAWYGSVVIFYVIAADTSGDGWAFYYHAMSVAPVVLLAGAGLARLLEWQKHEMRFVGPLARGLAVVLVALLIAAHAYRSRGLLARRDSQPHLAEMRQSLAVLKDQIPPEALFVTRGGERTDEHGHPVAFNESMAFTWLDRKGFNYPQGELSAAALEGFQSQGARFWLARGPELELAQRWENDGRLERVAREGSFAIYEIVPGSR